MSQIPSFFINRFCAVFARSNSVSAYTWSYVIIMHFHTKNHNIIKSRYPLFLLSFFFFFAWYSEMNVSWNTYFSNIYFTILLYLVNLFTKSKQIIKRIFCKNLLEYFFFTSTRRIIGQSANLRKIRRKKKVSLFFINQLFVMI